MHQALILQRTSGLQKKTFKQLKCPLLGIIVNRVDPENIDAIRTELEAQCAEGLSINFLPEEKFFSNPTMEEVVVALDAEWFSGPKAGLHRNIRGFKVAAMGPANFLDHIEKNDLVITPGDRPDILFATLGAVASKNYPSPVGILLSGKTAGGVRVKCQSYNSDPGFLTPALGLVYIIGYLPGAG